MLSFLLVFFLFSFKISRLTTDVKLKKSRIFVPKQTIQQPQHAEELRNKQRKKCFRLQVANSPLINSDTHDHAHACNTHTSTADIVKEFLIWVA